MKSRRRYSNPLPIEELGRFKRGLSVGSSSLSDDEAISHLRNDELMEAINRLEKENKNLHSENILYSRYLRRVESSKVLETFEEYQDQTDANLIERRVVTNQTTIHAKLPEIARRFSVKRSSGMTPSWSKLVTNWREYIYIPFLLRVEKEKLSIAAYEIEQTQLDWDRMKANAYFTLDHLDDLLRAAESDEIAQEMLITDFQKNINKFRQHIHVEKLTDSRFRVPAGLVINRITKQIYSRISAIGLLHINTTHTQIRLRNIEIIIHNLDDLRDQMDEIDINFVRTRKIDYLDTYDKLDRKYKIEKFSQYPVLNCLRKWKKILSEQEEEKINDEYKYDFLTNYFEKLDQEIHLIQLENRSILNENMLLKNRRDNIQKVPTITDYAHIIEQTKKLQHELQIWTKRVTIAQTLLIQLKRQTKSPNVLPPIQSTSIISTTE